MRPSAMTARYAGTHACFWAALCPLVTFSALYLQCKGFSTVQVGTVLSLATIFPAFVQPFLASAADRSRRWSLRVFLTVLAAALLAALGVLVLLRPRGGVLLAVFFAAVVLARLIEPLLNSIASYCFRRGIPLDFGISRSAGSLSFGIASLVMGYAAIGWGVDSLLVISALCVAGFLGCLYTLPAMEPGGADTSTDRGGACSLPQFVRRYPRYMLVMTGFFFIAAFHTMTETYLVNMMEAIGGDSGNVGVALLIANIAEFLVVFSYERFRRRLSSSAWLCVTALCFTGKAFLFYLAPNVPFMYAAQALQAVTYGFYAPSIVHFADDEIGPRDAVKGQSLCVAIFTLGCSLGAYLGGLLLDAFPVRVMNFTAFLLCAFGTVVVLLVLRPWRARRPV